MRLMVFGSNNPTGACFLSMCDEFTYETWGRNRPYSNKQMKHIYCDLSCDSSDDLPVLDGVLVSFAPVWLLSDFLERLMVFDSQRLAGIRGIIACSSSSFLTKRFAFSNKDRQLSDRLEKSHKSLEVLSSKLDIPCQVLAPTLVYGCWDKYTDKNISKLIKIMRLLMIIVLPAESGERQPIHASQLAEYAFQQSRRMYAGDWPVETPFICSLGGDEIMTYESMLVKLQESLGPLDSARRCRIIRVPDRIFFLAVGLILPFNPRLAEALLRISANLSGFKKVHELTGSMPKSFPVMPLSIHT